MPQHGFLRRNFWKVGEKYDSDDEAGCEFTLALTDVTDGCGDSVLWTNLADFWHAHDSAPADLNVWM